MRRQRLNERLHVTVAPSDRLVLERIAQMEQRNLSSAFRVVLSEAAQRQGLLKRSAGPGSF